MTNKEEYNKRHGFDKDEPHSKQELSKISKVPMSIINEVYKRGEGAYTSNPQSVRLKTGEKNVKAPMSKKMSKEQWSSARVYSFLNKVEGRRTLNHDKDLAEKLNRK